MVNVYSLEKTDEITIKYAIIGNAESLFKFSYGSLIDSHEEVHRFNKGFILKDIDKQGSKTDLVYLNSHRNFNLKDIKTPVMHVSPMHREDCKIPMLELDDKLPSILSITSRPSAGLWVLYNFYKRGVTDLSLFGFDFKATPTYYYGPIMHEVHDYNDEKLLVNKMVKEAGWRVYGTQKLR